LGATFSLSDSSCFFFPLRTRLGGFFIFAGFFSPPQVVRRVEVFERLLRKHRCKTESANGKKIKKVSPHKTVGGRRLAVSNYTHLMQLLTAYCLLILFGRILQKQTTDTQPEKKQKQNNIQFFQVLLKSCNNQYFQQNFFLSQCLIKIGKVSENLAYVR